MLRLLRIAALAIGTAFITTAAHGQSLTKAEFKCGTGTSLAFAQLFGRKAKCVEKCFLAARLTSGPYTDCFAPYGGATAACLFDPESGVDARARAKIIRRCSADCPECY